MATQIELLKSIVSEAVEEIVIKHNKMLKESIMAELKKSNQLLIEQQVRARKESNLNPYSNNSNANPYEAKPVEEVLRENLTGNFGDLMSAWTSLNPTKKLSDYDCH